MLRRNREGREGPCGLSPDPEGLILGQLSGVARHFEADQQFRIGRGAAGARQTRAKASIRGCEPAPFLDQLLAGALLVIKAYRQVLLDSDVPTRGLPAARLDIEHGNRVRYRNRQLRTNQQHRNGNHGDLLCAVSVSQRGNARRRLPVASELEGRSPRFSVCGPPPMPALDRLDRSRPYVPRKHHGGELNGGNSFPLNSSETLVRLTSSEARAWTRAMPSRAGSAAPVRHRSCRSG